MIGNGKNISSGTEITTQVCIVGSGPAGITAAWYLQKAGVKVTLIEGSRELDYTRPGYYTQSWDDKTKLYNGLATGLFATNEDKFLILPYRGNSDGPKERERVYGGTSTHWGGQCRPLNPITFEKRPGFPGWPITRADLDPYYKEAATLCKLFSNDFSAEFWARQLHAEVPNLDGFNAEMYQFIGDDWLNFATRTFDGNPIASSKVDVIVNASLLRIEHGDGTVSRLYVDSMNDDRTHPKPATSFTIKADVYVLACGAVANAQQLLLSNAGNENDLVGRYFMCHPLTRGQIISTKASYLHTQQLRLMDGAGWTDPSGNGVGITGRFTPTAEQTRALGIGQCWFWAGDAYSTAQYYFEMTPNYNSRITLNDTADPVFGLPQVRIDWQLSPRDEQTYMKTTALFKAAVNKLDGDVSFPTSWTEVKGQLTVNGHHIGTTRMSSSAEPTQGVVNENLQVHSIHNLYVAGASVFPSAGISNPTLTIITLSIRLAEHLKTVLGKVHY